MPSKCTYTIVADNEQNFRQLIKCSSVIHITKVYGWTVLHIKGVQIALCLSGVGGGEWKAGLSV